MFNLKIRNKTRCSFVSFIALSTCLTFLGSCADKPYEHNDPVIASENLDRALIKDVKHNGNNDLVFTVVPSEKEKVKKGNGINGIDYIKIGEYQTTTEEYSFVQSSSFEITVTVLYNALAKHAGEIVVNPIFFNVQKKVTSIEVSGEKKIKAGYKSQFAAKVLPLDAYDKSITWKSSDETAATVTKDGLVSIPSNTSKSKVTISALSNDGSEVAGTFDVQLTDIQGLYLYSTKTSFRLGDVTKKSEYTLWAYYGEEEAEPYREITTGFKFIDGDTDLEIESYKFTEADFHRGYKKFYARCTYTYEQHEYEYESDYFQINVKDHDLVDVKVSCNKDTFKVGESIDHKNLTVIAVYSDEQEVKLDEDKYSVDLKLPYTFEKTDIGSKQIKITHKTITKSIILTINPATLVSMAASVSKEFYSGDTLTTSDVVVTGYYSDLTSETITTSLCSFDPALPYTFTGPGEQTFKITYDGVSCELKITVKHVIKEIIVYPSEFTTKRVGDTLTKEEFTVYAVYDDGQLEEVDDYNISPALPEKFETVGILTFTISFKGFKTTLTVDVQPAELISISAKTTYDYYYKGESILASEIIITETYSDGTTKEVKNLDGYTSNPTIPASGYEFTSSGKHTFTFTNSTKTTISCSLVIDVGPAYIESLSAKSSKQTLRVGDTITTNDFTVTATYSDKSTKAITNYSSSVTLPYKFTSDDLTKGSKDFVFSIVQAGETISSNAVTITVKDADLVSIAASIGSKTYQVGQSIAYKDIAVTGTFSDTSTKTITNFTVDGTGSGFSYKFTKQGTHTFKISATVGSITKTYDLSIYVNPPVLTSITATCKKSLYTIGDVVNKSDFTVIANYEYGYTVTLTDDQWTASPSLPYTILGTEGSSKTFTITYSDKSTTVDISISTEPTLESITVEVDNGTTFIVGESLTKKCLIVKANYKVGSEIVTKELTSSDFDVTGEVDTPFTSTGSKSYTVTYQDKSASFDISIVADSVTPTENILQFTLQEDGTYSTKEKDKLEGLTVPTTMILPSFRNGKPITKLEDNTFQFTQGSMHILQISPTIKVLGSAMLHDFAQPGQIGEPEVTDVIFRGYHSSAEIISDSCVSINLAIQRMNMRPCVNLKTIDFHAFYGTPSLKMNFIIGRNVEYIAQQNFQYSAFTEVTFLDLKHKWKQTFGGDDIDPSQYTPAQMADFLRDNPTGLEKIK